MIAVICLMKSAASTVIRSRCSRATQPIGASRANGCATAITTAGISATKSDAHARLLSSRALVTEGAYLVDGDVTTYGTVRTAATRPTVAFLQPLPPYLLDDVELLISNSSPVFTMAKSNINFINKLPYLT